MYTFEVFRDKTLVCVSGGYSDLDSLNIRATAICKERKVTSFTIFKVVDSERMFLDTIKL